MGWEGGMKHREYAENSKSLYGLGGGIKHREYAENSKSLYGLGGGHEAQRICREQ